MTTNPYESPENESNPPRQPTNWWGSTVNIVILLGLLGLLFMVALDVQMLLGLLLYLVLSPLTTELTRNMGAAMGDPALRFWAVDHAATMFVAVLSGRREVPLVS